MHRGDKEKGGLMRQSRVGHLEDFHQGQTGFLGEANKHEHTVGEAAQLLLDQFLQPISLSSGRDFDESVVCS
jgi:hypothetical protein